MHFSHFPDFLSLVTAQQLTPTPALVFLGGLSLVYLTTSDVYRCIRMFQLLADI